MGLDQSFYKEKACENEVLYFRKFYGLQEKIGDILNEQIENGKTYRLEPDDLVKIRDYIALDGIKDYWAFQPDDDEPDDELPENFNRAIGVLSRYIALKKPLYYNGGW